jgi:hypothetical protein
MSRTRLAGAALLFIALLPGCGALTGDRRTLCERWRDCWNGPDRCDYAPVGYPVSMDAGCGNGCGMPIPGAPIHQGPPIYMGGPGASLPLGAETLPQPGGIQRMPPQIPKAGIGIDEGKGKQFDIDPASRSGPVGPALPVGGTK